MMADEEWLRRLLTSQVGRIWWLNFEYDTACGNLSEASVKKFYQRIEAVLLEHPSLASPLAHILYVVANGPSDFDLIGLRHPGRHDDFSTVLTASTFATYNINWVELGLELDEGTSDRVWDWLGVFITNEHYSGELRTIRPFFWCTLKRSIVAALDERGHLAASAIRDFLGLQSIKKGQHLLRIDIPKVKLQDKRVVAPTTLDAGINIVFCPSNDSSGFGWTMNLQSLDEGAQEVVIEQIPFDGEFIVTKIGVVDDDPPVVNWDVVENRRRERTLE
jgi:hypothetical protein